MANSLWTTHTDTSAPGSQKEKTLTENVSSRIELVVNRFLLFLLFFIRKRILRLLLSVDLGVIVKGLLGAGQRRRRRHWFGDNVSDVLDVRFASQNLRPHLGVWDGCRKEEGSEFDMWNHNHEPETLPFFLFLRQI